MDRSVLLNSSPSIWYIVIYGSMYSSFHKAFVSTRLSTGHKWL